MSDNKMKVVSIYTDGACSGNPGPGGWAAIIKYNEKEKVLSGYADSTTNNRMELTAIIEALKALKEPCEVYILTDSKYVVDGFGRLSSWQANSWIKSDRKPVLNRDLWEELIFCMKRHNVRFEWIKGHSGHAINERCNSIAILEYVQNKADK